MGRTVRLFNTLGRRLEPLEPIAPPRVGIYVCGPTVYDTPHIGNARPAVTFDILRRHLTWRGFDVLFVRNITDVDDKIIDRANEDGMSTAQIAERYTRIYEHALEALNCLPPDIVPRASGHIPEMLELIARLVDAGFAYPGEGSVYFAVEKFARYGCLSGRGLDELANRERVEPAPGKHHPLDFALWKAAKPGEPAWTSPWGPGRPGWHIECSAMATKYLGQPFDIHGGGSDLVFPHHENEIAQSEAAYDSTFAKIWLHNGYLDMQGEKMSKSLKNIVSITDVLGAYSTPVIRLFFAGAHYRSQLGYGPDALDEAAAVWERFRAFLRAAPAGDVALGPVDDLLGVFGAALDDDLNTPEAIAALHELLRKGNSGLERGETDIAVEARAAVARGLEILGCPVGTDDGRRDLAAPLVELLLEQREEARRAKDFERADRIRSRLARIGVRIEDSAGGSRWFLE